MDQFLLSASSNQLFVHQIGLPTAQHYNSSNKTTAVAFPEEFWFKYVHQVKLENCKNITAISAPNQVTLVLYYTHIFDPDFLLAQTRPTNCSETRDDWKKKLQNGSMPVHNTPFWA